MREKDRTLGLSMNPGSWHATGEVARGGLVCLVFNINLSLRNPLSILIAVSAYQSRPALMREGSHLRLVFYHDLAFEHGGGVSQNVIPSLTTLSRRDGQAIDDDNLLEA